MSDGLREVAAEVLTEFISACMIPAKGMHFTSASPASLAIGCAVALAAHGLLANPPQDAGERLNTTCGECGAESWTCSGCGVQRDSWDWPTAAAIVADQP